LPAVRSGWKTNENGSVRGMTTAAQQSYFSKPYAPAWGILIGTAVGVPIELVTPGHGAAIGALSMLGLIIGMVIYYEDRLSPSGRHETAGDAPESRLRELQRLRTEADLFR
jgi:hypothetical protein